MAWEAGKPLTMEKVEVAPPRCGEVRIKVKKLAELLKQLNTIFQEQWLLLKFPNVFLSPVSYKFYTVHVGPVLLL